MTLLYLLVAYGVCFGLQNKIPWLWSSEFLETGEPHRFLDRLLFCTYCTGFHCGWLMWFLAWGIEGDYPLFTQGLSIPLSILAFAFASSGFCYAVDALVKWAEANTGGD